MLAIRRRAQRLVIVVIIIAGNLSQWCAATSSGRSLRHSCNIELDFSWRAKNRKRVVSVGKKSKVDWSAKAEDTKRRSDAVTFITDRYLNLSIDSQRKVGISFFAQNLLWFGECEYCSKNNAKNHVLLLRYEILSHRPQANERLMSFGQGRLRYDAVTSSVRR